MWTTVSLWCGSQAARVLPPIMLKRFFSTKKVEQEIGIDWSSKQAARIGLNASCPNIEISLRIENRSLVPVILDRMIVQVWIGQPFIEAINAYRMPIGARKNIDQHITREYLSENQIKAFASYLNGKQLKERLSVSADLFFDCDVGSFHLRKHLDFAGESVHVW